MPFNSTNSETAPRDADTRQQGLTFVELIVTVAILSILAMAALPVARFQVKRQNERELKRDLWMMRDAIDKYKDAADRGAFQTKVESRELPARSANARHRRGRAGQEAQVPSPHPGRSNDGQSRVGHALHAG